MPAIYNRPENEKYLYRHAQHDGWNVRILFFGEGPDVGPSVVISGYFGDSGYGGDPERSKAAARRFRNMSCRELGLPIPKLTDRYRKHAPPHWSVAKQVLPMRHGSQRRAGQTQARSRRHARG